MMCTLLTWRSGWVTVGIEVMFGCVVCVGETMWWVAVECEVEAICDKRHFSLTLVHVVCVHVGAIVLCAV